MHQGGVPTHPLSFSTCTRAAVQVTAAVHLPLLTMDPVLCCVCVVGGRGLVWGGGLGCVEYNVCGVQCVWTNMCYMCLSQYTNM